MTNTDIMMREINNDLRMEATWHARMYEAEAENDREYYKCCMVRSMCKAEAKAELIQSLGYTVLYNDERDECIAIYPMELDD